MADTAPEPAALPWTTRVLALLILGTFLKRWLVAGALGLAAIAVGMLFIFQIPLGPTLDDLVGAFSLRGTPSELRGGAFIALGVALSATAVYMVSRTLSSARSRSRRLPLIDSLYVDQVLAAGPKIVVIGGGSGLPNLLRGMKHYTANITAVVTVADDGGSSGRLRSELDIPPPGDIRNCLVALADSEAVMQELMDYRFSSNGQLDGHSFGNMLIAALADIGGDFNKGVEIAGQLLAVRGKVVPSTSGNVTLVGRTVTGQSLIGESQVGSTNEPLGLVTLAPRDAPPHPDAVEAIAEADLIILGPGSLFTSVVPNLLVTGISEAVANAGALKMFVCNVACQAGETDGFTVQDHVDVIRRYAGPTSVDVVIANNNLLDGEREAAFDLIRPEPVRADLAHWVLADVINEDIPTGHHPTKLALTVSGEYQKRRGSRTRLPRRLRNTLGGG